MPFIQTGDATTLFYSDWGEGKAVVFAHAWALNSDMWAYQVPDLTDAGLRCVTYDRRGHGRSDRPRDGYGHDTFADDLASLAAAHASPHGPPKSCITRWTRRMSSCSSRPARWRA